MNISKPNPKKIVKIGVNTVVCAGIDTIVWHATKAITPATANKPTKILMQIGAHGLSVAATSIFSRELDSMLEPQPIVPEEEINE